MSRYVDCHRGRFGVEPICRVLGVSASAYYQRATGQRSARAVEDERLLERIRDVQAANYYAYGYRRTWKALLRAGEPVGRDHVRRLMRANAIQGAKRRGKPWRTTIADPAARRSPDLVRREFTASRPDQLWVADFTYLRCWEGLLFFSFVIDVFSRRVVGWQLASHMRTDLVLDALRMALSRRHPGADVQLVHHSDAGSQPGLKGSSQHRVVGDERSCDWRFREHARGGRRGGSPVGRAAAAIASGRPAPSSSWPSSNGSAGSTMFACTRRSATSRPPSSKTMLSRPWQTNGRLRRHS